MRIVCDDLVGGRVDSHDARPGRIRDPDGSGETATPANCPRMWIVALTVLVFGSMRVTVCSWGWESQTAPPPAAAA